MKAQAYTPRRATLGDDLYFLRHLCEQDVRDIHVIVKYKIRQRCEEEYARIRAASKVPPPLPFKRG
jgi:hypothetical protein